MPKANHKGLAPNEGPLSFSPDVDCKGSSLFYARLLPRSRRHGSGAEAEAGRSRFPAASKHRAQRRASLAHLESSLLPGQVRVLNGSRGRRTEFSAIPMSSH